MEATREGTKLGRLKAQRERIRRGILAKQAEMEHIQLFGVKSSEERWNRLSREVARDERIEDRILREIARMEGRS